MQSSVELLKKLKKQHDKHTVSVLVGAGFSKNAINSYPGWDELLHDLVIELYGKRIKEHYIQHISGSGPFYTEDAFTDMEIANIIHDVGYLKLVSKYIEDKGYREAIDVYIEDHLPYIEEVGGVFTVSNMPTVSFNLSNLNVHKELLLCKWKHIYTTNYDNLLELTNDLYGMDYKKVIVDYRLAELSEHRGIVKVHGSLVGDSLNTDYEFDNDKSRRYIISEEDYATYAEKHQAFSYQMKTGLLTGVFCLIGFSGNDPNFLAWLEWMKDVLDKNVIDNDKENSIKIFLLTLGQQHIEKSRQLFFQNHHIGVINVLDTEVLKQIGANPLVPDVKAAFTFLFRYLNDGTAAVVNPVGSTITNTISQYYRAWSAIDTNNVTVEDVNEVRRLRKTIVFPPTTNRQRLTIGELYDKKEWTKQDAELFAIACLDCGLWHFYFRSDEKKDLLKNVKEWQQLQQMGAVLHNDEPTDIKDNDLDWNVNIDIARHKYLLEPEGIKAIVDGWDAKGPWVLNKAAALMYTDVDQCRILLDDYLSNSTDIERRYYAAVLGNVITMQLPHKYSYNEYKVANINGFFECWDAIIKKIRGGKKEDVWPYGSSGWSFVVTQREEDIEEAFRFIVLLFISGFPIQYGIRSLISHQDWYEIFRRVFVYIPYPALYYSLQLTDQKTLRRIGQDYAYAKHFVPIMPDLLKRLLKVVIEDNKEINKESCIWVAKEMLCSVADSEWYDLMVVVFKNKVVPNARMFSSLSALYHFMRDAAFYLKNDKKKSDYLELLLEHFDDNTYFYADTICSLLSHGGFELTERHKKMVTEIVAQQPLNRTYLLVAQLDHCKLLEDSVKQQIVVQIKEHPEEVQKAPFEVLHSLTYVTNNDTNAINVVKHSILDKDIWNCGISDSSATVPKYLSLNKISKEINWTPEEMKMIIENLQKNLQLLKGWKFSTDAFFAREHLGLLTDMKEFVERNCIDMAGLSELSMVLEEINGVMVELFGSPNVLDTIFDKDAEVSDELHVLARCIDFYDVEKYKVYVDAVIDRALLQCEKSLTSILSFVEYLVDKHNEVLQENSIIFKLKLMLEKYVDVNYPKLDLLLPVAYRCMHNVAKALHEMNLAKEQTIEYWLEDEFVRKFTF